MPYSDRETHKKAMRNRYSERYYCEPGFKKKESDRKASWYDRNREKVIARVLENRAKQKASK